MSLYLNSRGIFTNSGGHTKSFKFLPVKLNSYQEISVHFSFKFELDVDSFGSRRGVNDSEVVSAIALVLNLPANLLFLYLNSFFWPSAMKFEFYAIVVVYWTVREISIQCYIYHRQIPCASLNYAIYFPSLGYTKYGNGSIQRKNKQIFKVRP